MEENRIAEISNGVLIALIVALILALPKILKWGIRRWKGTSVVYPSVVVVRRRDALSPLGEHQEDIDFDEIPGTLQWQRKQERIARQRAENTFLKRLARFIGISK